jgi:hypothetical protein
MITITELVSSWMPTPISLLDFAIAELFVQVSLSGRITLADRYGLQAALLTDTLSDEERFAIDRLLYAVRKGRVKVINELSSVI